MFEVIGQTLREDRSCELMTYFSIAYTVTVQYVYCTVPGSRVQAVLLEMTIAHTLT